MGRVIRFDQANEVRAIARERVGRVKPSKAILPKTKRKLKHAKNELKVLLQH